MPGSTYLEALVDILKQTSISLGMDISLNYDEGLAQIIDLLGNLPANGKKVMFIGNGGSAGIASHMALDFWKNGGIKALCFNDGTLLTCIANDFGYEQVFAKPVEMFAEPDDVLVAVSSSGQSANIIEAVKAAQRKQCWVVTLSGFAVDNPLRGMGDYNIYVPSREYGFVEVAHQTILHCLLDTICNKRKVGLAG